VTNYSGDDPSCTPHAYTAGEGFIDQGGGGRAHAAERDRRPGGDDRSPAGRPSGLA
jgi:hypothetical protein